MHMRNFRYERLTTLTIFSLYFSTRQQETMIAMTIAITINPEGHKRNVDKNSEASCILVSPIAMTYCALKGVPKFMRENKLTADKMAGKP